LTREHTPPSSGTLQALRALAATNLPMLLLAVLALALAYWMLDPTPPRRVVLATGVEQGAYAEFGRLYAERLAAHGIDVELRPTQGAAENLALLRDPASGVDIGFVQGGSGGERRIDEDDGDGLVALGSLFFEPVWLFYREDSAKRLAGAPRIDNLTQLAGWRINVGAPGSGVPPLMAQLLEANRIEPGNLQLSQMPVTPAVVEFLEGRLDALVMASAPESLMVQMLLQTPGVRLIDFAQADAYARRFAFMSKVVLPRGVVDLAADRPPEDVRLVAPTATLVANEQLHPALVQLFVQTAQRVHGEAGWFQGKGDFPNAANTEWPLAAEAQRFYRSGVPWLQRYLPFWLANLIDRMWLVIVSIIAVALPLSRVVPPMVEFRIRSRVFRWYAQLREVEAAAAERPASTLLQELDDIEAKVGHISVPLSYADELYALRSHIQLVRRRLQAGEAPSRPA
jgi:TRAP-type uncharacterized transport system substrate-binding protein